MRLSDSPRARLTRRQKHRIRTTEVRLLAIMSELSGDITIHRLREECETRGLLLTYSGVQYQIYQLEQIALVKRVNPKGPPPKGRPRICYALTRDGKREARNDH